MKRSVLAAAAWPWLIGADAPAGALVQDVFLQTSPDFIPLMERAGSPDLFPMPDCNGFKLEEATIAQMQEAMEKGMLTSVQLVHCYMTRTLQTQHYINSVMEINPDVYQIAAARDSERTAARASNKKLGPLHGIPFTVKDNIATLDSMETTAGSWALLGSRPPRDAHVVAKLREAGAVLFGKATLSEWADMRSTNYSEGYSARGGQCRSAYNFTVNPGGSSSGSGVGVGANVIAFSLGTETDGSVINPAMRNSIVGFKPTVGLTSRAGVIPESEHQDSVGSFGRTVADAVLALDAIWGPDVDNDNYTSAIKVPWEENNDVAAPKSFAGFLAESGALCGSTFGLPWDSLWAKTDDETRSALLQIVELIKGAGATIVNHTEITNHERIVAPDGWDWDLGTTLGRPNESEYTYVKVDFYNNINKYLSQLTNTAIKTFDDIVKYNVDNAGSEGGNPWPDGHPAFFSGQDGFLASLATKGTYDEAYFQSLDFCSSSTRRGIDDALAYRGPENPDNRTIDALLVPIEPGQSYQLAAQAGYPMVTLPAGIHADSGMGIGLGLMQTAWKEAELVKWASAIEHLQIAKDTPFRRQRPTWRGYLERPIPVPL
ncbi:hypothetical protein CDD81_1551 [Ophiocordyceps australis]|uniref:Amidase domain-containing protein n=1 Tax=Ophiocordyceps australis TaxID=1399860 RepID=A0A2C5XYP7_9HYPO|nr:hypothetical protein CDD81_1551 [Ophiocordyceps australis]